MKYLRKFNEDILVGMGPRKDFSQYFPISDEDISDMCLELTDAGFKLKIYKNSQTC